MWKLFSFFILYFFYSLGGKKGGFFLFAVVTFSLMATRYNLPAATTSKKMTIKEIHDLPTENSKNHFRLSRSEFLQV